MYTVQRECTFCAVYGLPVVLLTAVVMVMRLVFVLIVLLSIICVGMVVWWCVLDMGDLNYQNNLDFQNTLPRWLAPQCLDN